MNGNTWAKMKPPLPTAVTTFRLSSLLRLQKDPILALRLFQNPNPNPNHPTPLKPFRYSLLSYDLIITKLGRAKMFDEMHKTLLQLKAETHITPKEVLFCNVIGFYGRAHLPDNALKLFDEIPSFRCQRTIKSFNSLLNALLVCKEFDKMEELFASIENFSKHDACTYNLLIRALCANGRLDCAWKVFDEMKRRGVRPNVVTFGNLVYGLCLGLRLEEAIKLKTDMVRIYGVQPNAHVYASLFKGLCQVSQLDLAFRLKNEMIVNRIKLNSAIYSTLLNGLLKAGRKEEAFGLLKEMSLSECKPDTVTYNVLINGLCKDKDFEAAYKLLEEMVEKGVKPDVISFNVILRELCSEGKSSEASDLFEDMPRRGCKPDIASYRILFDGLCNGVKFKEAAFILDEMIFKGFAPCGASVSNFVDRLCKEKNEDLLWCVLDSLGKGRAIHVDSWTMALSLVFEDDKLSAATQVLDKLTSL